MGTVGRKPGVRCDGKLLRNCRNAKKLRQLDVAGKLSCSVRRVLDAENGLPVSLKLAEAFAGLYDLSLQTLTFDPVAFAAKFMADYAEFGMESVSRYAGAIDPHAEVRTNADWTRLPFVHPEEGPAGFTEFVRRFFAVFEDPSDGEPGEVIADGNFVSFQGRVRITAKGRRDSIVNDVAMNFKFRDGKIIELVNWFDVQKMMAYLHG